MINYPLYDEDNAEIIGEDSEEEVGLALVMKRTLLAPKKHNNEEWLRSNIFHATCNIGGRVCCLVIDDGSCENVVSQEVVDKLGLQTELHPQPYKLTWLKKDNEVKVTKRCLVNFSIRQKYQDSVLCDVVHMDACHLLLGRPWQYDRETKHDGKKNTYSLCKDGQHYTLLPSKEKVIQKTPINPLYLILCFVNKNFVRESLDFGFIYMLLSPMELDEIHVPPIVKVLMEAFEDVFPKDLPTELPPMRDIQYAINLEPGSTIPNRVAYRMTPMEKDELHRQVQELLTKVLPKYQPKRGGDLG